MGRWSLMSKKPASNGWSANYLSFLSKRVRELRDQRGMSAQQVADRCEALGYPMNRAVLSQFENGRRDGMDVRELLVLAAALDVSPFEILVNPDVQVELPRGSYSPVEALAWMAGLPQPAELDDAAQKVTAAADAIAEAEKALSVARGALVGAWERRPAAAPEVEYDDSAGVL